MKAKRMAYNRKTDPVLSAVIAEINKSAVKPDPGFLKRDDWAERWQMANAQASIYLRRAVASGILVVRRFRVITNGRLRVLDHFGPPEQKHCRKPRKRQ
jgi:hypothetical protein